MDQVWLDVLPAPLRDEAGKNEGGFVPKLSRVLRSVSMRGVMPSGKPPVAESRGSIPGGF